jgi:Flp pilus assembly pilin Flp
MIVFPNRFKDDSSMSISKVIRRLASEEDGATMVEYTIMAALIAAACAIVVGLIGESVRDLWASVQF